MSAKKILLNIDIGERGADHPVDRALMRYVDIVNIACGGHAGDAGSVAAFRTLAERDGIMVAAHLSYPDRANFGRVTVHLPFEQLRDSLDAQLALMRGVGMVKFHGALYNDCCADESLAAQLGAWLADAGMTRVITLAGSALDGQCRRVGISVMREAFAERRHSYSPSLRRLALVSRTQPDACITDYGDALENARTIIECGKVQAWLEDGSLEMVDADVDTICIHSDSPIALELAKGVAALLSGTV